jgi:folate-binding protein YgfZ
VSASQATATAPSAWANLEDQCVLSFRGSAVRDFLGRQLTCDVAALAPGQPQFGAWLTVKGRVHALLRLIDRAPDRIDAIVAAALADELIRRMRMFVMRDDVSIEVDARQAVLGVWGDCIAALGNRASQSGDLTTVQVATHPPLAMLVGSSVDLQSVCAEHAGSRGDAAQWRRMGIEAGLPQVDSATREAFIPQMINLDRLGAVSFSKGCYPGQEIVARTQHLGRIKRRMFIARAANAGPDEAVQPGDVIVGGGGEDIGGRVVSFERTADGCVMLAVLPLDSDSSSKVVRIQDASGTALEVFAPPYSLTDPGA